MLKILRETFLGIIVGYQAYGNKCPLTNKSQGRGL